MIKKQWPQNEEATEKRYVGAERKGHSAGY